MQRYSIRVLLLLAGLLAPAALAPAAGHAQDFDGNGEQQMLARINAMRAAQQLAPLTRHASLDQAARAHAVDMAAQRQLTHVSSTSGTPADRVRAAGIQATTVAENVALHRTAEEAHQALLASDAHRTNMMSPTITHTGLAALRTEQGVYVTQVFAAIAAPQPPAQLPSVVEVRPAPRQEPVMPEPSVQELEIPLPIAPPELAGGVPDQVEAPQLEAPQQTQVAPLRAPQAQPSQIVMQPGTNGSVLVQRTPDGARIEAYWVYGSGRWWFYPMPDGAQGGQRLVPDMNVAGPPPGYPEHPFGPPAHMPQQVPQPQYLPPPQRVQQPAILAQPRPYAQPHGGQLVIQADPNAAFYAVPPPPLVGNPDRNWRAAQRNWERAYRRWLRDQARARRHAL